MLSGMVKGAGETPSLTAAGTEALLCGGFDLRLGLIPKRSEELEVLLHEIQSGSISGRRTLVLRGAFGSGGTGSGTSTVPRWLAI